MGLSHEEELWRACDVPVFLWEREGYRAALVRAIQAVDDARQELVKTCQRIERQG